MSPDPKSEYTRDGFLLLKDFYNVERQISPIQNHIQQIIALVASKHGVEIPCSTPEEAMSLGYSALIKHDRNWGSEVYDAVKQIPSLLRLVSGVENETVYRQLRPDVVPGIAAGGYGIRIDNPNEHKFRAAWHQEFPAQLRSVDGIVFWTPLLPVTAEMGPVEIAQGSHVEGIVPVYDEAPEGGRSGAYALRLKDEQTRLARYPHVAPLSVPGDLLVMDFLTLHQSGYNASTIPRWSIQFRLFNFADPIGVKISWQGSFADKKDFRAIMPELRGDL